MKGIGPFFANQLLADVVMTGLVRPSGEPFVELGPGPRRAIKFIFGEKIQPKHYLDAAILLQRSQHSEFQRFEDSGG